MITIQEIAMNILFAVDLGIILWFIVICWKDGDFDKLLTLLKKK